MLDILLDMIILFIPLWLLVYWGMKLLYQPRAQRVIDFKYQISQIYASMKKASDKDIYQLYILLEAEENDIKQVPEKKKAVLYKQAKAISRTELEGLIVEKIIALQKANNWNLAQTALTSALITTIIVS